MSTITMTANKAAPVHFMPADVPPPIHTMLKSITSHGQIGRFFFVFIAFVSILFYSKSEKSFFVKTLDQFYAICRDVAISPWVEAKDWGMLERLKTLSSLELRARVFVYGRNPPSVGNPRPQPSESTAGGFNFGPLTCRPFSATGYKYAND